MILINKKAVGPVVGVILLVAVSFLAANVALKWFQGVQSDINTQVEQNKPENFEILGIKKVGSTKTVLGVKGNLDKFSINKILINGVECEIYNTTNSYIDRDNLIYVECPVEIGQTYSVSVFTNQDIRTSSFTVFEEAAFDFSFVFRDITTVCSLEERKIYAIDYLSGAHAELPNVNSYQTVGCLYHISFSFENECSGLHEILFYIGNTTNSHIYVTNTSAYPEPYPGYYNWQEVCISSPDANSMDLVYGGSAPNKEYVCVGSIERDDIYGGHIGKCDTYSENIWFTVS